MASGAASGVPSSPTGWAVWNCSSRSAASSRRPTDMRRFALPGVALLMAALLLRSTPAGAPPVVNDGHGDYVYVPAGAFRMGDNFGDGDPRERPVHLVELDRSEERRVGKESRSRW